MDKTQVSAIIPGPDLYRVSHYFSDRINRNIIQSEIDGGVYMKDLASPERLCPFRPKTVFTNWSSSETDRRSFPAILNSAHCRSKCESRVPRGAGR